jgi:hypothetical protein
MTLSNSSDISNKKHYMNTSVKTSLTPGFVCAEALRMSFAVGSSGIKIAGSSQWSHIVNANDLLKRA